MTGQPFIFSDFDGTLMDTERHALPSLIARFNQLNGDRITRPLTMDLFTEKFHGQTREGLCENLGRHFGIAVDCAALYHEREENVARYYAQVEDGIQIAPGAIKALEELKFYGWGRAIVTNNPLQRANAAMRCAPKGQGWKLQGLFGPHMYQANAVLKPLPDPYLFALEQTGADPKRSVAVEDSVPGVQSAVAAGQKVIGFTGFADDPDASADRLRRAGALDVIRNWRELRPVMGAHGLYNPK